MNGLSVRSAWRKRKNNRRSGLAPLKDDTRLKIGVIGGLKPGYHPRTARITRGQTGIRRLDIRMGVRPGMFTGSAGIGDLVLTCTSDQSRNRTVGKRIGEGKTPSAISADMRNVAEGVNTARSVYRLSRNLNVDMPTCHTVYRVLYDDLSPREGLYSLMARELKHKLDDV